MVILEGVNVALDGVVELVGCLLCIFDTSGVSLRLDVDFDFFISHAGMIGMARGEVDLAEWSPVQVNGASGTEAYHSIAAFCSASVSLRVGDGQLQSAPLQLLLQSQLNSSRQDELAFSNAIINATLCVDSPNLVV